MGAIVGRVANRIGGAACEHKGFLVRLAANEGAHQLHGGPAGLWCAHWDVEPVGLRTVRLVHVSAAGANGFPGTVAFEMAVTLEAP